MSLSASGGDDFETATFHTNGTPTGVQENVVSLEATEDREIHSALLAVNSGGDITVEASFSANMFMEGAISQDDTAGGVVAMTRGEAAVTVVEFPAPILWNAGEEIHIHVDNATGSGQDAHGIIGYVPVGEFSRQRLRDR
jgi:hypothetical protein